MEALVIDPHGKGLDLNQPTARVHQPVEMIVAKEVANAVQKMVRVPEGVETDQVGSQHPSQDLLAPGEEPEDLKRWKGDVQEETDRGLRQPLLDQSGEKQQVIILGGQLPELEM